MSTQAQKAQEQYELFEYCLNEGGHNNYLREFEDAKRYYASRHWLNDDEKKRTSEGRLSFTVNEIFKTINAVRGELEQLTSDVRFDPTTGDPEVARVLNRLNEHVDRENKLYMHDGRVLLDGLLGGRGYWRIRVKFDENMQGHIEIFRERPDNVVLDPNITSPDPKTWPRVMTTEIVSSDDIMNMFGKDMKDVFSVTPYADWLTPEDRSLARSIGQKSAVWSDDAAALKMHRLINHQYYDFKYKECFVDQVTGDISEIPENWPREKISAAINQFGLGTMRRKIKTVRWRVTCNNVVLHDEDSLYKHFDIVPFFPWFIDDMPLSLFTVLKGPQDLLNYTVSEETYILGNTAHSGWKIKAGALRNMTSRDLEKKGGRNGVVLELDDVGDAERIQPGQPAAGFAHFGDRARSWISELASVTPSMLGAQSEYANGKNISSNLQRAPVNLHAPLQMFQFAKHLLAERKLDLFQSFYTESRTMRIATSAYGQPEEVAINQPAEDGGFMNDLTIGKYSVRLLPVGSRQAADEFAFDQLALMKELGINVPNSLLVSVSAINAKSDAIEQLLAANKGELSPEEQELKQLELEQARLDVADTEAGVQAKLAAAELASGRAARARVDASFDPRTARAKLDQQRLASEHERGVRQIEAQKVRDAREAALKTAKLVVDASKPPPAKAPAKKAAKKTAKKTPRKK